MSGKARSSEKLRFIVSTERHRVAMARLWEELNTGALAEIENSDISVSSGEDLRQKDAQGNVIADPQTMYRSAEAAHNQLTPLLQRLCDEHFEGRVYPPNSEAEPQSGVYLTGAKAMEAVVHKAQREYAQKQPGPPFAWVHDIVRQLIVCDSDTQAAEIVRKISSEVEVVKLKNRFLKPTMTGFMDILMNVRLNGFICELQIQLLPLFLHEQDNYFHERYEMFREYLRGPEDLVSDRLDLISYLGKYDDFDGQGSEYTKPVHLEPIVEDFLENVDEIGTERMATFQDLCEYLGDLPAATKLQEKLVEMFRSNGVESDIGSALNNLGMLLQVQNQLDAAHRCFEEALVLRRQALGDGPDVDASIHNLGLVLRAQGKVQEAIPLYRELLELKKKRVGDEHSETDLARANLAALLASVGELEEAEQLGRHSLAVRRKVLGNNHPEVGKALNNLAVCLRDQQKFEEAEGLLREALNTARQALGPGHPIVAGALNNLAMVMEDQNKFPEAEPLYHHALQTFMQTVGQNHPETVATAENLGNCLEQQSKFKEAEEMFRLALNIKRDALGENHPDTISTRDRLAAVLRASEKHEEAEILAPSTKIPFATATATATAATPATTDTNTPSREPQTRAAESDPQRQAQPMQEQKQQEQQQHQKQPQEQQSQARETQVQQKHESSFSTPIYLSVLFAFLVALIAWVFA